MTIRISDHYPQHSQQGFTLVELIVVLALLGILATTAVIKFIDITNDARRSVLLAKAGDMESVIQLADGKALVTGVDTQAQATIQVDGGTMGLINGYPMPRHNHTPPAVSIGHFLEIDSHFHSGARPWIWGGAADSTFELNGCPNGNFAFRSALRGAPGNCYLEYVAACTPGSEPQVVTEDEGC